KPPRPPIAGDEDHAIGLLPGDEGEKPFLFGRKIAPALALIAIGLDLDGRDDEAQLGLLFELAREPIPLRGAEHGAGGVGIGNNAGAAVLALALPGIAERADIEQDHLHAPAGRSQYVGIIEAGTACARRIVPNAPEIEKQPFGAVLLRKGPVAL